MSRSQMLLAASFMPLPAFSQHGANPAPCDSMEAFHRIDFWLGNWRVESGGEIVGSNRIAKVREGCAVEERWTDAEGGTGQSLFYYQPAKDEWHQVWLTPYATVAGGIKRKQLIEAFENGGVRFQGTIARGDGSTYLDRTTLRPMPDGTVSRHIQLSKDGGATWNMDGPASTTRLNKTRNEIDPGIFPEKGLKTGNQRPAQRSDQRSDPEFFRAPGGIAIPGR